MKSERVKQSVELRSERAYTPRHTRKSGVSLSSKAFRLWTFYGQQLRRKSIDIFRLKCLNKS